MRAAFDALGPLLPAFGLPIDDDGEPGPGRPRYRSVFVSDFHLGTPGCQAAALLDFLKSHPSDHLYLVGDIVDGWQLRKGWYWPQSHNDVVQKVLRRARKGCRVVYVPGNHDEFARQFAGVHFGGVEVVQEAVHVTAAGQQLWVIHGDAFDGVIQCAKWLAHVGDTLYEFTLRLNRHLNQWRGRFGLPYWSLSACFSAITVAREDARQRALDFSWAQAASLFAGFLVPARPASEAGGPAAPVTQLS